MFRFCVLSVIALSITLVTATSYLPPSITVPPLFYFPLNGNYLDISGNGVVADLTGITTGYGFVTDSKFGTVYEQNSRTNGMFGGLVTNQVIPAVFTQSMWIYIFGFDLLPDGQLNTVQSTSFLFGSSLINPNDSTMPTASVLAPPNTAFEEFIVVNPLNSQSSGSMFINLVGLNSGTWYQVVNTIDSQGNFNMYVNGVNSIESQQLSSSDLSAWTTGLKPYVTIGYDNSTGTFTANNIYGKMWGPSMFDYVLTPTQVEDWYQYQNENGPSSSSSSNLGLILGLALGLGLGIPLVAAGTYVAYQNGVFTKGAKPSRGSQLRTRRRTAS